MDDRPPKRARLSDPAVPDALKMLAPGFSLAKLCQTVGLGELSKGLFPFSKLVDRGQFLDEPELPPKAEDWFSIVKQTAPSQDQVNECLAEYSARGYQKVRQYLLAYLTKDLQILIQSVDRLFTKLKEITGVHPMCVRKLTLSGFSFYSAQMTLVRGLRPGNFICNQPAMYSSLKAGLRGGCSVVCRSAAGLGVAGGLGEAVPNGHILPGQDGVVNPLRGCPPDIQRGPDNRESAAAAEGSEAETAAAAEESESGAGAGESLEKGGGNGGDGQDGSGGGGDQKDGGGRLFTHYWDCSSLYASAGKYCGRGHGSKDERSIFSRARLARRPRLEGWSPSSRGRSSLVWAPPSHLGATSPSSAVAGSAPPRRRARRGGRGAPKGRALRAWPSPQALGQGPGGGAARASGGGPGEARTPVRASPGS
jgi:hypothetical protein